MDRTKRLLAYTFIFVIGLCWTYLSKPSDSSSTVIRPIEPHVGFQAPEISLRTFDGEEISLSDYRGKPVIVNFWASWCPPCRAEMPALEKTYVEYRDKDLVILGINGLYQDSRQAVAKFTGDYGLSFPILADEQGMASKAYQVSALPTTFFIDANGIIQDIVIGGPMAEALLRTRINNLVKDTQ